MKAIQHRYFVFAFCCMVLLGSAAPPKKKSSFILQAAPVFGFYTINKNHAQNQSLKPGLSAGFKKEFRVGNEFKTSVLIGIDYFFHGLTFESYYFKPDTIHLYDKSFGYTYSLFIHELNLPVQFKYLFRREDNSLFSPYVAIAWHLRYLLPGRLSVKQDGQSVISDGFELKFKNPLFYDRLNAFMSVSFGWQKSNLNTSSRGSFFAELNFKYGFSQYYFEKDYAASSLFINATHLSLLLGVKF